MSTKIEINGKYLEGEDGTVVKPCKSELCFEAALEYTGIGKYNYTLLAIALAITLCGVSEIYSVSLVIETAQCDLELDSRKKGLIASVPMLGIVATSIFWGILADRYGRKCTLIMSMAGTCLTSIISGFATTWIFLLVAKFLSSACASGIFSICMTIVGESIPVKYRTRFLLLCSTTLMTGQGLAAVISYPILLSNFTIEMPLFNIYYKPWRLFSQSLGILTGLCIIFLCFLVKESPKFYFANDKHDEGLEVLKHIYKTNTGKSGHTWPIKSVIFEEDIRSFHKDENIIKSIFKQITPLFYKENIKNFFLVCYISIMVYTVGPSFAVWVPMITEKYSNAWDTTKNFCELMEETANSTTNLTDLSITPICDDSLSNFTLVMMVILAFYYTAISLLIVILVDYIGKKPTFTCVHLFCGGVGVALNTFYNFGGVIAFFVEMTTIVCGGIVTTYAVDMFPTTLRAMAVCTTIMIGRFVSFFIINIVEVFLQEGCYSFMYGFACYILSGASAALLLPPST